MRLSYDTSILVFISLDANKRSLFLISIEDNTISCFFG